MRAPSLGLAKSIYYTKSDKYPSHNIDNDNKILIKMMKMTKVKTIDYNYYKNNLTVVIIVNDVLIASVQKINNSTACLSSLQRRSRQNIIRTSSLIFPYHFDVFCDLQQGNAKYGFYFLNKQFQIKRKLPLYLRLASGGGDPSQTVFLSPSVASCASLSSSAAARDAR